MTDSGGNAGKNIDSRSEQSSGAEDDYERAMRPAFARMKEGIHLGGTHKLDREALHDRKGLRRTEELLEFMPQVW